MPYRADIEALKIRHAALEREVQERRERARQLEAMKAEQEVLERELAETRALLDGHGRRALPLLDSVRIASPCSADWNQMVGDDRVRFCGSCQKNVYDLSKMTREEGEALIRDHEVAGDLCARLYRRADGTLLTADCPVGLQKKRVHRAAAVLVSGGAIAASVATALAASTPRTTMGTVRAVEPVATAHPATAHPTRAAVPTMGAVEVVPPAVPVEQLPVVEEHRLGRIAPPNLSPGTGSKTTRIPARPSKPQL